MNHYLREAFTGSPPVLDSGKVRRAYELITENLERDFTISTGKMKIGYSDDCQEGHLIGQDKVKNVYDGLWKDFFLSIEKTDELPLVATLPYSIWVVSFAHHHPAAYNLGWTFLMRKITSKDTDRATARWTSDLEKFVLERL